MKIGRNDPCPCGSGQKYKNCHYKRFFNKYTSEIHDLKKKIISSNQFERNILLIQAIDDVFGFSRGKTLDDVRSKISGDQIKELYEIISNIWTVKTDIYKLLPEPSTQLSALYLGDVYPEMIIQNVIRYSLYTDKIYVINPFLNPWSLKKEFNPLHNPNPFKSDTLKLIVFMGLLEPWIRAGIIELIPSPVDYDYKLKMETFKLAEIRLKDWTPSQEDIEESEPYTIRETMRFLSNLPKEAMIQHIKNTTPNINDKEVETLIQHFENDRKNDPYALNQTFNGEEKVGQFNLMRTGANLEMALYLSQLTGAYPYTNIRKSWKNY